MSFAYRFIEPEVKQGEKNPIADFVESIGMFKNDSDEPKQVVVMPDGRVDLFFWQSQSISFQAILIGLETYPEQRSIPPRTTAFTVSFKPLAVEYILQTSIAEILDSAIVLPDDFWGIKADDLSNFDAFFDKVSQKITSLLPEKIDDRKHQLFELIYASKGQMSVNELADKVSWSSRQINRYFTQRLGLSLKAYCTILRFRASLEHIAKGKLFPELNFADQNHFIKEIKKFSGVVPKELSKNADDRFVLLSELKRK